MAAVRGNALVRRLRRGLLGFLNANSRIKYYVNILQSVMFPCKMHHKHNAAFGISGFINEK